MANKELKQNVINAASTLVKEGKEVTGENLVKKLGAGWLYDTTYITAASGKKYQRRYIQHNGVDVVRIDNVTKELTDKPQKTKTNDNGGKKTTNRRRLGCESLRRLSLAVQYCKNPADWLKDDTDNKKAANAAAAAFEYLNTLPSDNAAAAYIETAKNAALSDIDNIKKQRETINAAADKANRRTEWLKYKESYKANAAALATQQTLLESLPENLRQQTIEVLKANKTYIETPAPFFCGVNESYINAVTVCETTAAAALIAAKKTTAKKQTKKTA